MIDVSFLNDELFMATVFYLFAYGFLSWFMGWGVSLITSLFIKIFEKGV